MCPRCDVFRSSTAEPNVLIEMKIRSHEPQMYASMQEWKWYMDRSLHYLIY